MRFVRLLWITSRPGGAWVGSVSNKHNPSKKLGLGACISSRITTVIHVIVDHQINYNCFNEPFAVSPYRSLYWDMHGLIFETSIWLLAGSTRLLLGQICRYVQRRRASCTPQIGIEHWANNNVENQLANANTNASMPWFELTRWLVESVDTSDNTFNQGLKKLETPTSAPRR